MLHTIIFHLVYFAHVILKYILTILRETKFDVLYLCSYFCCDFVTAYSTIFTTYVPREEETAMLNEVVMLYPCSSFFMNTGSKHHLMLWNQLVYYIKTHTVNCHQLWEYKILGFTGMGLHVFILLFVGITLLPIITVYSYIRHKAIKWT